MQHRILLVDDDADARRIFGDALAERGYLVELAVNGAEAVHLARRGVPDLVLMDIRMPVMDAWGALSYLRADGQFGGRPIWAISAYLDEESTSRSAAHAFDRVFAKPLDPHTLVEAVDRYFGRQSPPSGPAATVPPEPA